MESVHDKIGRYELLAQLATGGMAEIFLARQSGIEGFERLVVVKKLLPHLKNEKKFLDMFLDEARIAAQLAHPNIVQIYDLGQEEGEYFIAMEYLEGESLGYLVRQALVAGKRMPPELALSIAAQVCDGLDCAHNLVDTKGMPLRVVHRDVSPQNIIVLFSGGVKLVDFGVAKAASKIHHTKVGTLKGKFAYMSPEQCLGMPVDGRSDLFSLGTVLWEVITCRRLFKRDQEAAIIHAILNKTVRPPSKYRQEVGPEVDSVILEALARDPDQRFQSAADMAAALREALRHTGRPAGAREIANFVKDVFADRARTKKALLAELRQGKTQKISISMLKPETEESLPSSSAQQPADDPEHVSWAGEEDSSSGSTEMPTMRIPSPFAAEEDEQQEAGSLELPTLKERPLKLPPPLPGKSKAAPVEAGRQDQEQEQDGDFQDTAKDAAPLAPEPEPDPLQVQTAPIPRRLAPGIVRRRLAVGILAALLLWVFAWWLFSGDSEEKTAGSAPADAGTQQARLAPPATISRTDAGRPADSAPAPDSTQPAPTSPGDGGGVPPAGTGTVVPAGDGGTAPAGDGGGNPGDLVAGTPAGASKPVPRKRPRVARPGRLRLDSVPWSEVYLGRKKLGITPLLGIRLPAGRHRLTLVNPASGKRRTITVIIRPSKTTKMFLKL